MRLLLAVAIGGAPLTLLANGLRLASQDAFATARGEAFAATVDNPSAIYYNPAGIAQLDGIGLRGGFYGIYYDPSFTPPPPANTNHFHLENKLAGVPQLFATYASGTSPLSFGAGVYAPFGGGVSWPQDTGFRAVATEASLTYLTFNPVVALKLAPSLSLAAGLTVNYANISLEQGLLRTETPFANHFRFSGDGWSAGYNLGVLWRPHANLSFGAAFRSSSLVTMKGHTEIEQQPIIGATERDAQADFTFPWIAVVGVSWRPTPKWNLEFDADCTDWRSFDTVTIQQESAPFPVRQNVPVTLEWQTSWMYKFGVTRYFDNHWHISAGYVFSENSVPDDYYSPLAADMDRHFIGAGLGRRGRRYDFDVAYQFGYGPPHTVTGSTPSSTPGRFVGQR
ncbi:MAG TPA: outer membrane protein transport protein, partial [Verrucomicrobiae bacterium]